MLLFIFLSIIVYFFYIKFIEPSFYWQKKKIFHVKPWGRFLRAVLGRRSFFESVVNAYNEFPERRYFGSYQFFRPSLFVRDLDLIKRILVKDFESFPDHLSFGNKKSDPVVGHNLFSLEGEKWRDMRSTLSPTFTSSKMKLMYILIQDIATNFTEYFCQKDDEVIELELKNAFAKYTNDVIASCAFGINCNSLVDEKNEFFTMGATLTSPRGLNVLWVTLAALFPKCFECFRIPFFPPYIVNFFRKTVKEIIAVREKENIMRPDMIHLLMEARKGRLKCENENVEDDSSFATVEETNIGKSARKINLTDDVITAQAVVFFLAGFDTSSTLLSFLSYELALHPELQRKLQREIDDTLQNCNEKFSYEAILKMKYLDQVVSETLRKYPPGYILNRVCAKDYKIEAERNDEVVFVLEKGSLVTIPVGGVHMDPNYFAEPHKFDPDRFSEKNKEKIIPGSYMPFGNGPRNCIGSRFALLQSKTLIVTLLSKFDIVPVKKTQIPIKLAKSFSVAVKDGFWLGFKKRTFV